MLLLQEEAKISVPKIHLTQNYEIYGPYSICIHSIL